MVLEFWDDGHWRHVAETSLDAGIRFLERCRPPQPWRLCGGGYFWKTQAWSGRVVRFRESRQHGPNPTTTN